MEISDRTINTMSGRKPGERYAHNIALATVDPSEVDLTFAQTSSPAGAVKIIVRSPGHYQEPLAEIVLDDYQREDLICALIAAGTDRDEWSQLFRRQQRSRDELLQPEMLDPWIRTFENAEQGVQWGEANA